jgi:hypothetical protein
VTYLTPFVSLFATDTCVIFGNSTFENWETQKENAMSRSIPSSATREHAPMSSPILDRKKNRVKQEINSISSNIPLTSNFAYTSRDRHTKPTIIANKRTLGALRLYLSLERTQTGSCGIEDMAFSSYNEQTKQVSETPFADEELCSKSQRNVALNSSIHLHLRTKAPTQHLAHMTVGTRLEPLSSIFAFEEALRACRRIVEQTTSLAPAWFWCDGAAGTTAYWGLIQ